MKTIYLLILSICFLSITAEAKISPVFLGLNSNINTGSNCVIKSNEVNCSSGSSLILGSVFIDQNSDCTLQDSVECGLIDLSAENWVVKAVNNANSNTYFTRVKQYGAYYFCLDSGTYDLMLYYRKELFAPCNSDTLFNVNTGISGVDSANDFGLIELPPRPLNTLSISSGLVRRGRYFYYRIAYSNVGTATSANTVIEVDFDRLALPISSSPINWSSVNGTTYTFNVGNLYPGQSGYILVYAYGSIDLQLGQAVCTEGIITPIVIDSTAIDTSWDKSSIAVEGFCNGDSAVCFTIRNTGDPGDGDMEGTSEWRIYEDNVLMSTQPFQLNGADSLQLCFTANGTTLRLEADQRPGHPGNSNPRSSVELCGSPNASFGMITSVPQDNADPYKEAYCVEVIGSYDPNDKQVFPKGITTNNYIKDSQKLEYKIRFQNTGNDTAFYVALYDTLDIEHLDITSVQLLSASHPYTFEILGENVLLWEFNNILLPDSNVNEPASHGYVTFKVEQNAGNPENDTIHNRAGIYFDFNDVVMTNTVWNIINDTVLKAATQPLVLDNLQYNSTVCQRENYSLSASASGGNGEITYIWNFSDTTNQVTYMADSTGNIAQTLQVEDRFLNTLDTFFTINVLPVTEAQINISSCESWLYNGQTFTSSQLYTDTLVGSNSYGCDSIVHFDIEILKETEEQVGVITCDEWEYSGLFYTTSLQLSDTLTGANAAGCDSIVHFDVTINYSDTTQVSITILDGDSVLIGDNYYYVEGTYTDSLLTTQGCDSVVFYSLSITPNSIIDVRKASLKVYPNPSSGMVYFPLPDNGRGYTLSIYNEFGQLVMTREVKGEQVLDFSKVSAGLYQYVISSGKEMYTGSLSIR